MARPQKSRHVKTIPGVTYFKPRGIPMSLLEEVTLTIDECEALRLADLDAHSQEEAAAKMKISRATFGRVIEKARKTVVDGLVNGKAIRIEGGNYRTSKIFGYKCKNCKRNCPFQVVGNQAKNCPYCKRSRQSQ
jgi:predicted DNA-binding protein (UPF0251 family)